MFFIRLVYIALVWLGLTYLIKLWNRYRLSQKTSQHPQSSTKKKTIKNEIRDAEFEEIE